MMPEYMRLGVRKEVIQLYTLVATCTRMGCRCYRDAEYVMVTDLLGQEIEEIVCLVDEEQF